MQEKFCHCRPLRNAGTQGKYNKPGLPNITGIYAGNALASSSSGVFYASSEKKGNTLNPAESTVPKLGFDASRSNAMYGSSDTVMPSSVDVVAAIYLGRTA